MILMSRARDFDAARVPIMNRPGQGVLDDEKYGLVGLGFKTRPYPGFRVALAIVRYKISQKLRSTAEAAILQVKNVSPIVNGDQLWRAACSRRERIEQPYR